MKLACILIQAALVVLAVSVQPSSSHVPPSSPPPSSPPPLSPPPSSPPPLSPPPSSPPPLSPPPSSPTTPSQSTSLNKQGHKIEFTGIFKKVYAFGGSSTDSGNARIMGFINTKSFLKLEAGSDDPAPFWAAGSSKNLDRNGLSDGNLMIDFLCESLGLPKLEPYQKKGANFSHGANFAIAGCPVLRTAKRMFNLWWKNMPDGVRMQLHWFEKFIKIHKQPNLNESLFWLGMFGADDYAEAGKSTADFQNIATVSVEFNCNLIKGLSAAGAKYIVVQGLPPLGCTPSGLSVSNPNDIDKDGCAAKINTAIMYHNDLLQKKLNEMQSQNPAITIIFADSYKAFMKVFKNYQKFHFSDPTSACCGFGGGKLNFDPNHLCGSKESTICADAGKHISWDGIHFTAAMDQHISSLFLYETCCYPSFVEIVPKIAKNLAKVADAAVTGGMAAAVKQARENHRAMAKEAFHRGVAAAKAMKAAGGDKGR